MSKRVRTSRIANSKKSRRVRPSGEREVAGRESLSSVDFDDSRTSGAPSQAPSSLEASPASDTNRPAEASIAPAAATSDAASTSDDAVVPALVTGLTPPPAAVSVEEIVPGDLTPPPAPAAAAEATASAAPSLSKKDKKKNKAARAAVAALDIGGTRPEDAKASSGALSLNEPLARGFYESALPADHDHDHDHDEAARPVALSPEVLERKARLRRIVMGVFAAASFVVILVAGKTLLARNTTRATDESHAIQSAPAGGPAVDEAPKAADAPKQEPASALTAAKIDEPKKEEAKAEEPKKEEAKADEPKKEEAKAEEPKKEEPAAAPAGDPAELKKTATKLYNSGKLKDAIPALRSTIAADPDDALFYLYLGDALTNTGKWPEAKEAYNECVRHAKKGPKYECSAMGGHK